jgi:coiled-coil domain-containing protein 55
MIHSRFHHLSQSNTITHIDLRSSPWDFAEIRCHYHFIVPFFFSRLSISIVKMNINLAGAASKKKKKQGGGGANIGFGLNKRGSGGKGNALLDAEDDDDSSEEHNSNAPAENSTSVASSSRAAVNRELAVEQAALRKRAREQILNATKKNAGDSNVYDYDGVYDSLHPDKNKGKASASSEAQPAERKSRYISDLLKASEKRKKERDFVHERKVAKEQAAEEEEDSDLHGKEKFVTAAYKRKLEERELWKSAEEVKEREEEKEDVTKKTGEGAMASFYGNLNKNVAMGGAMREDETNEGKRGTHLEEAASTKDDAPFSLGFMDGFETSGGGDNEETSSKKEYKEEEDPDVKQISMRQVREAKIAQARIRYFQRQGVTTGGESRQ